jgi:hypothetical protein
MVLKGFIEDMLLQFVLMHPIVHYGGVFIQYFKVFNTVYYTTQLFNLLRSTDYFLDKQKYIKPQNRLIFSIYRL